MKKFLVAFVALLFLLGMATSAMAATSGDGVDSQGAYQGSQPYSPAPLPDGDNADNGIGNANETGLNVEVDGDHFSDVIKSDNMTWKDLANGNLITGSQRTHGEYQNNTNSCASCHQTHTAAAKDLLFKNGVYNTCTACHDGTLGFYNVFEGSTAGTFGGTKAGNASIHLADGSLQIKMAPGGNHTVSDPMNPSISNNYQAWKGTFDCASCHAPHGSYSDRLLHYDPNHMAGIPIAQGGQQVVAKVYTGDTIPAATDTSPDYIVWKTTKEKIAASGIKTAQDIYNGDALEHLDHATDTEPIVVVLRKGPKTSTDPNKPYTTVNGQFAYYRDLTPWMYGYSSYSLKDYFTYFANGATKLAPGDNMIYEYGWAFAKGSDLNNVTDTTDAYIALVYVVKFQGEVIRTNPATKKNEVSVQNMVYVKDMGGFDVVKVNPDMYDETSKGIDGYGVRIGKYCGACHTDYRASSGKLTGMFSQAFRHTTNNDRYTCLKCHFAHGTDVTVMWDAFDNGIEQLTAAGGAFEGDEEGAKAYLLDKNPSSALKRYTNMAVCWKCHTDSHAVMMKQNSFFWDNYDKVPHGGRTTGRVTSTYYNW